MIRDPAETGPRGRALLSAGIVAFLVAIALANLPPSGIKGRVMKADGPFLSAVGARQVWSVFAPDPARVVIRTEVRFRYADGTTGSWRIKKMNPVVGAYRDYRWLKLGENSELPDAGPALIDWAVRNRAGPGRVVQAALVRQYRPVTAPGKPASDHPPFRTQVLYALDYGHGR